jgi:hypothetical protein
MALGMRGAAVLGVAIGVGVGVGLAIMAPSLFPRTARAARPLIKKALHDGMSAYLRTREGLAEFGEFVEDLVAEVEHDVRTQRTATAGAAAAEPPPDQPDESVPR